MNKFIFNICRVPHISKKLAVYGAVLMSAATLNAAGAPVAGKAAPDFTFTSAVPLGKAQKLSDYRGKPVVLHFWATWCGPCVRELPLISELGASKSGELTVLAVNCGETEDAVSLFLSKRKIRLNLVMDKNSEISRLYGISAIPQTFMIDADGIIRSARVGAYNDKDLDQDVSALLVKK
ncbi:MAG: TlpA family protein disulfide reductase [Spirochaetaceae bacterium]|jgi:thiol-disulfide isomerase/thioredoxin|nr:TlpA family protein disulfide reductase [Spirochaetaceae bacterium]